MSPVGPYASDTVGLAGSVAAPGAGGAVSAVIPDALLPGIYSARIIIELSGTVETQLANLRLRVGGVNKITLPSTPGPSATVVEIDRIAVGAAVTVDVVAIAAATGGSIYTVTILLTRIG